MFKSMKYVLTENFQNFYRIFSISKYEVLADIRDSRLGIFWNFANPAIQVFTYWFAFGLVFNKKDVTTYGITVPYIFWQIGGIVVWFFLSPCITQGCSAIHSKINVITHMKFPVSVLPATVVGKNLFDHGCIMALLTVIYICAGYPPTIHWLGLIYYCLAAICFAVSLALCTSVLTMLYRDVKKLVSAFMRLLLYMTPILWDVNKVKNCPQIALNIVRNNPIYYIVQGYRDCFFFHQGIMAYRHSMIEFWIITLVFFVIGSSLMYHFKFKFIDLF